MNWLLALAVQNTLLATVLALVVACVTRLWRNPPLAHVLWLLVLVKLVTPPIFPIDASALGWGETSQTFLEVVTAAAGDDALTTHTDVAGPQSSAGNLWVHPSSL